MNDVEFHNGELEKFMTECTSQILKDDDLLLRVREYVTKGNLQYSNNSTKRKLRDYLDSIGV